MATGSRGLHDAQLVYIDRHQDHIQEEGLRKRDVYLPGRRSFFACAPSRDANFRRLGEWVAAAYENAKYEEDDDNNNNTSDLPRRCVCGEHRVSIYGRGRWDDKRVVWAQDEMGELRVGNSFAVREADEGWSRFEVFDALILAGLNDDHLREELYSEEGKLLWSL